MFTAVILFTLAAPPPLQFKDSQSVVFPLETVDFVPFSVRPFPIWQEYRCIRHARYRARYVLYAIKERCNRLTPYEAQGYIALTDHVLLSTYDVRQLLHVMLIWPTMDTWSKESIRKTIIKHIGLLNHPAVCAWRWLETWWVINKVNFCRYWITFDVLNLTLHFCNRNSSTRSY